MWMGLEFNCISILLGVLCTLYDVHNNDVAECDRTRLQLLGILQEQKRGREKCGLGRF